MSSSVGRASFELDGGREGRVAGRVSSRLPGRFGAFPLVTGALSIRRRRAGVLLQNGAACAKLDLIREDNVPTAGVGKS